jgi:hypothetical protein
MSSPLQLLLLATILILSACQCDDSKLRVDPCAVDPASCEPPPDEAGSAEDGGSPDAGEPYAGACPDVGSITGRVCAPDERTWLNGATVSVDALDCNGRLVRRETTTAADGTFTLTNVPARAVTVRAVLGAFTQDTPLTVRAGTSTAIPDNQLCVAQKAVRIAVVTGSGDKIEDLLTALRLQFTLFGGDSSTWTSQAGPFLADLAQLKQYDLIFINCAAAKKGGSTIDLGAHATRVSQNLHDYVLQGGSVYTSDWGLLFAAAASPGSFTFSTRGGAAVSNPFDTSVLMGFAPQTVSAIVRDPALAQFLGKSALAIEFPKQAGANSLHWGLLASAPGAQVLVSANTVQVCADKGCANAASNPRTNAPLAVRARLLPVGQKGGNVVYTSFHNVAQRGDDVAQVLKYLVLNL